MTNVERDQLLEFAHQRRRLLRVHVDAEHLDRHQAIAAGLMRAEHRTEFACADLMENPERAECLWWKVQD